MSSGGGRLERKALSRVGQREIDVPGVIGKCQARLGLIEGAGMEKRRHVGVDGLDVRRATLRIDNAPWPVIALRICQRFLVRVLQSRSNEMCAPCSSPRNAAAARRETSSREPIERVTLFIPVSIDRRPARNRPVAAHSPRETLAFRAAVDQRCLCDE